MAVDSRGNAWVAYDSYKNGDYDVFLTEVRGGRAPQAEVTVSATPRFEARATVAVDAAGRVWVAWQGWRMRWSFDERIHDAFYSARSLNLVRRIVEAPLKHLGAPEGDPAFSVAGSRLPDR